MLNSFLNDVDIKLILEFKDNFGKYCSVFPKFPKNWGVEIGAFGTDLGKNFWLYNFMNFSTR